MRQSLEVRVSSSGLPFAEVSFACLWDLVEFLSFQRATVSYEYHDTHFTVTFARISAAGAGKLLDEWTHAPQKYAEDFEVPARVAGSRQLALSDSALSF